METLKYKGMQITTDHWVLTRLFVIVDELSNIELSMARAEKQMDGLRRNASNLFELWRYK